MKKTVGYVRVSTVGQVDNTSLEDQRKRIRDRCNSEGFEFIRFYEDKGITGSIAERPEFQRMMDDARAGFFDGIVFLAMNRLSRNLRQFLGTFEELKDLQIGLLSLTEPINTITGTMGDVVIQIFSVLAEFERQTIMERTKAGRVANFTQGKTILGSTPYGYAWNSTKRKVEIIPECKKVYDKIVDMFLAAQLSTTQIAEKLTALKYPTPGTYRTAKWKSTKWSADMVRRILRNPAYCNRAKYLQHGYEMRIADQSKMPYYVRSNKRKDNIAPISFKYPPMISKAKWDDIQAQICSNKKTIKKALDTRFTAWHI